jgi:hypothetical protein
MIGVLKLIKTAPHFALTLPIQRNNRISVLASAAVCLNCQIADAHSQPAK